MQRRNYLALIGTAVGSLSGCLADSPGASTPAATETATPTATATATPTTTQPRTPMGQTITLRDTRLRVANPRVRTSVFGRGVHDPQVRASRGQYVVVDVTRNGEVPTELDDESLRAAVDGDLLRERTAVTTTTEGTFAVAFPASHHDRAAVVWQTAGTTAYWTLPEEIRASLPREPVFGIEELGLPWRDGRLTLALTVANDGNRDGHFLAEVSMEGYSGNGVIEMSVPAGTSRTYRGQAGKVLLYFQDDGGGTLTIQYPGVDSVVRLERTTRVTTPATEAT